MCREAREVGLRGRSHHSEDEVAGANSRLADGHDGAKIPAGVQLHERSANGDKDRRGMRSQPTIPVCDMREDMGGMGLIWARAPHLSIVLPGEDPTREGQIGGGAWR